jgi:catechol 2,3-dioxygenase-like lactoylglutathione lyase family enzyme
MKRMHVHVGVKDLDKSIAFYSALFATQPKVVKSDYAKWMLDDPRVNFAISTRGKQPGLDHLGIQVETQTELHEVYARLRQAGGTVIEQGQTACCYAQSEKSWIDDPSGIAWETLPTGACPIQQPQLAARRNFAWRSQMPSECSRTASRFSRTCPSAHSTSFRCNASWSP